MFNKRGSTLIESLFAFEIFVVILTMYATLITSVMKQEIRLKENYNTIIEKEKTILLEEDFSNIIEMVLHL